MTTEEGNKIIAEFMGAYYDNMLGKFRIELNPFPNFMWTASLDEIKYHSSWDWLMPVVEKINALDSLRNEVAWADTYYINDYNRVVEYGKYRKWSKRVWRKSHTEPKINAVWLAVIEFINWYNKNKDNG